MKPMRLAPTSGIDGATRIAAVFGHPVGHSLSPAMHNAAYAALKLNRVYVACDVTLDALPAALKSLGPLGFIGVNLTVPHKQAALRVVKNVSAEARLLGAANCIINRPGGLYGDNTDARGLELDLRERRVRVAGKTAVVIGAGGAATAAVLALIRLRASRILIVNRTPSRARALVRRFAEITPPATTLEVHALGALRDRACIDAASLIVNATPMGLESARFATIAYAASAAHCLFYDLIYAPGPTPFLKPATELRRPTADGAGMLLYQGSLAFRLFNRVAAPIGAMRAALMERLGRS
jgi:shikimate dehydrogenase